MTHLSVYTVLGALVAALHLVGAAVSGAEIGTAVGEAVVSGLFVMFGTAVFVAVRDEIVRPARQAREEGGRRGAGRGQGTSVLRVDSRPAPRVPPTVEQGVPDHE